jgi:uncharacterized membrane protein YwzB
MKTLKKLALGGGALLLPMFAFAQSTGLPPGASQLGGWIIGIRTIINMLIPIVLALIFLMIIWNAVQLVNADGEEKAEVRGKLINMIIVFFVVMSLYGIVYFIGRTLGIGQGGTAAIPCVTGTYDPVTKECR